MNEITRYTSSENGEFDHLKLSFNANISGVPALEQLNDKQKQQVCANVLSAIVGVAVFLKDDQIISQAFSMLALRRKMLSPPATASLTLKLVDLALVSPQDTYVQIIELLATFSKEAVHSENNLINTSVSISILNDSLSFNVLYI